MKLRKIIMMLFSLEVELRGLGLGLLYPEMEWTSLYLKPGIALAVESWVLRSVEFNLIWAHVGFIVTQKTTPSARRPTFSSGNPANPKTERILNTFPNSNLTSHKSKSIQPTFSHRLILPFPSSKQPNRKKISVLRRLGSNTMKKILQIYLIKEKL